VSLQLVSTATCGDLLEHLDSPSVERLGLKLEQERELHPELHPEQGDPAQSTVHIAQSMQPWGAIRLRLNERRAAQALAADPPAIALPFTCWLELWTNLSSHRIPLTVISGALLVGTAHQVRRR
jgi:hypothetical protein